MQYFGAFTLLVLPLFLVICVNIINKNPKLSKSTTGKALKLLFYSFASLSMMGFFVLFLQILSEV